MMKGFRSTVVHHSTFEISSSENEVKSVINRRFRFRRVKINGEKTFRRSEIQGRIQFLELRSMLNRRNVGGLRFVQI